MEETKISVQDLINVRLALEGIANPTREIVEARQHLDNIILQFTKALIHQNPQRNYHDPTTFRNDS